MWSSIKRSMKNPIFWIAPAFLFTMLGAITAAEFFLPFDIVDQWKEQLLFIKKAFYVFFASFVLQLFFSLYERDETIQGVKKNIKDEFWNVRDGIIKGAEKYRFKRIIDVIKFEEIIKECEDGGEVGIFFSYCPELSNTGIYSAAARRRVRTKLILSSPGSEGIKFKFNLLEAGWPDELQNLNIFVNQTYPTIEKDYFEMRLADNCVDIPLVVVRDGNGKIVRLLSGFYSIKPAIQMPWLEWECCDCYCEHNMATVFGRYFDKRWIKARILPKS